MDKESPDAMSGGNRTSPKSDLLGDHSIKRYKNKKDLAWNTGPNQENNPLNPNTHEETATYSKFFERIGAFPVEAQEFIAGLSNIFLEKDIYDRFKQDVKKISQIEQDLKAKGLADDDVDTVLGYFSFSSVIKGLKEK